MVDPADTAFDDGLVLADRVTGLDDRPPAPAHELLFEELQELCPSPEHSSDLDGLQLEHDVRMYQLGKSFD